MASNLTTAGATAAMTAVDGGYWVGLGTGKNSSGLLGEPSGAGYARVAVTITATGATGTNAAAVVIAATSSAFPGLTHAGLFTAATGGACHWVGELNTAVTLGPNSPVTIQAGDFDVAIEVTP